MAKSKYEYVKLFEQPTSLLRNTWIVIRLDGHAFHRFTKVHAFAKPNDPRSLHLLNACAATVMKEFDDMTLAYGQSDEFSFVLRPSNDALWPARGQAHHHHLLAVYGHVVMRWPEFFPGVQLQYPPSFDARAVCYPTLENLRDYMSWRQVDCHINNLYNTVFWAIVLKSDPPRTEAEAETILKDTNSSSKNEMLFSQFGINYNALDAIYRKGSVLLRRKQDVQEVSARTGEAIVRKRNVVVVQHDDIIGDQFWLDHPQVSQR